MQVIYFLFALEKFQCLFELISVSFHLCNLCLCEFLYRICGMKMMSTSSRQSKLGILILKTTADQ